MRTLFVTFVLFAGTLSLIANDRNDLVGKSFGDLLVEGGRAFNSGNYDRVIELMDYALTLRINNQQAAQATTNRAAALTLKNQFDAAIKDFDAALRFNPNAAEGYLGRGAALATM